MAIINLTPHEVVVETAELVWIIFPPEGTVARCTTKSENVLNIDGIPILRTTFGEVENLPEPQEGTFFIVSALVRQALPNRKDLLSPADLIRNEAGQIIGCRAFDSNL